jgi:hypothetical protein
MTLTRALLFVAFGIGLLIPRSSAVAQEAMLPPPMPVADGMPPENVEDASREPEGERASPFEDKIETDRDAFTPVTTTAGVNRLIMESSYSFIDNRGAPDTHSFPELLFRYGVLKRLELRLGWNYEVGGGGNVVSGNESEEGVDTSHLTREQRMLYGLKVQVSEQDAWMPASVVILQGFTPTGGDATATQLLADYAFGWRLPNRWRFDSSIRFITDSDKGDRFEVWAPSAVLRIPIGERFQVHAEYFGLFSENRQDNFVHHFFSPGTHYLITPNLEVGLRVGWGLNEQSARFFSNVGFGVRF